LKATAVLLAVHGQENPRKEERCRRFIFIYCLSDDTLSIYEPPIRNSGFVGGKYLDRCRVARPGSRPESPTYYGPQDLYIGAVVDVFRKRFVITDADYYVLKYIEEHEHQFPGSCQLAVPPSISLHDGLFCCYPPEISEVKVKSTKGHQESSRPSEASGTLCRT